MMQEHMSLECNWVGHMCWHANNTYVLAIMALLSLVAMDLSSKKSYVCHPLSGKAASSVCLLFTRS